MPEITGTFAYGDGKQVAAALDYDGDERTVLLAELTLHLPADQQGEADGFTSENPLARGSIAYDRDPGNACLETVVAPRGGLLAYTVTATIDGHAISEHGVTGGETNLAWRCALPPRTPIVPATGVVHELTLEGGVSAADDAN